VRDDKGGGRAGFEDVWREHRPFLVDLAFRMLGNIGDAEDVVQDAFARLLRVDGDQIDDVRGWLVVVVTRLCLDILRSARVRRERRADQVPERLASPAPTTDIGDPADRVTLDDHVRMALLVVLEKLSPPERAVFVLHEVFRYPFAEIAAILGRSADSCRKLASRARHRVEAATVAGRFAVEPAEHRQVAEQFIAACAGGDVEALTRLLDADVAGDVDLGTGVPRVPAQTGRDHVARNLVRFFDGATGVTLVSQELNGWPGVLAFKGGRLYALVVLELRDGLVKDIHAIRNPHTLAAVGGLVETRR
jgi:RNA polymerase sigma-70 factor (ECF subfamily)